VYVALVIRHAMRMRRAIFTSVVCPAVPYLFSPTFSHKRHDFREKKVVEDKIYVFFSLQLLPETFLILRKNQRDTVINVLYIVLYVNCK